MLDGKKWTEACEAAPTNEFVLATAQALLQSEIEHGLLALDGCSAYSRPTIWPSSILATARACNRFWGGNHAR